MNQFGSTDSLDRSITINEEEVARLASQWEQTWQRPPSAQGKLVRVVRGSILDIAVDIREGSPTYGQHFSIDLSAENQLMFWIPPGFAHGFETLENNTVFLYKCTNMYDKNSEGGLLWNDPAIGIKWQTSDAIVSEKDQILPLLKDFVSPF